MPRDKVSIHTYSMKAEGTLAVPEAVDKEQLRGMSSHICHFHAIRASFMSGPEWSVYTTTHPDKAGGRMLNILAQISTWPKRLPIIKDIELEAPA